MTGPIVHVGIELAKNVFALQRVDDGVRAAPVRPSITRDQLMEVVAKLPACSLGMGACSGAHHEARQFVKSGQCGIDRIRIDGIDVTTAIADISESGADISRFQSVAHFASSLGLFPGTKITGGKVKMGMRLVAGEAAV